MALGSGEHLTAELVRLEQTLRAKQDEAVTERERNFLARTTQRRQHNSQLPSELDDQSRSFTDRLETLSRENNEYLQIEISNRFSPQSGQMDDFKDQVRQFPNTIVQFEKKVPDEQVKRIGAQADLDQLQNQSLFQSNNV